MIRSVLDRFASIYARITGGLLANKLSIAALIVGFAFGAIIF